jgi:hypothetical protein
VFTICFVSGEKNEDNSEVKEFGGGWRKDVKKNRSTSKVEILRKTPQTSLWNNIPAFSPLRESSWDV